MPSTAYFPVSLFKLVVMSISTLSLYEIYWFYRNWDLVRAREISNISAVWRSIFAIFFCYALFSRIRHTARDNNIDISLPAGPLAAAWIAVSLMANLPTPWWMITFLAVFFLLPVQAAVNRINAQLSPGHDRNSQFSPVNIAIIFLGGCVVIAGIAGSVMDFPGIAPTP